MVDQTKHGISDVISENHARRYENETRRKFETWLEDCPVMFASEKGSDDPDIKTYKFKITKRRK